MREQKLATMLPPLQSLSELVYESYVDNIIGDQLWLNMVDSSQWTNAVVDNALDIENTFAPPRRHR